MTRPGADVREAERLEQLADVTLVERDAETLDDDGLQVDPPPARHAVGLKIGTSLDDRRQLRHLSLAQSGLAAFAAMIVKALGAGGVKAMHPITQRLAVHPADPGRLRAVLALANRRQRQQPPALVRILRPLGQPPKIGRRIVLPKRDRTAHGTPPRSLESAINRFGKPSMSHIE
jgi:hypothetical protein